jgi:glutamyl-tRNA synthetase
MTDRPLRVRFAPSPTGYFHVGGARTALYNHIVARQHGGTFILRIEDTDADRNRPEWTQGILDALTWIGCEWDEGPYFQSERRALHSDAGARLYEAGAAYYCDCTRDAIAARTTGAATPGYDGFCRDRALSPAPGRALRFRTPREGVTTVVDVVRGMPTFENRLIEDFVILRGDGSAVFLLANVVDDMDMKVSHVIRGEEHLPNTPKAQLLWGALGGEPPVWAHAPVLVNEKRQKLSKRRDKVALESYRDEGYVADAMRNYLMTLGWAPPGDVEIVPWQIIMDTFRLDDVNSAPAFFDVKKLLAFNDEYVRAMPLDAFVEACRPWITPPRAPWPPDGFDEAAFVRMAPLVQERCKVLSNVPAHVDFLFLPEPPEVPGEWDKGTKLAASAAILDGAIAAYETGPWSGPELKAALETVAARLDLKLNKAQAPVRVAVTGRTVGPPLFESMEVLGRPRTLERLRRARQRLEPTA